MPNEELQIFNSNYLASSPLQKKVTCSSIKASVMQLRQKTSNINLISKAKHVTVAEKCSLIAE